MRRVLVTGFEPFHQSSRNPSEAIVHELAQMKIPELYCEVLPVVFGESADILLSKIVEIEPEIVIGLGQAEGRNQITPERVAVNIDDARIADNKGEIPTDQAIVVGGANAHFTSLPVKEIVELLSAKSIPAALSMSAGTFVCNHLFYRMQEFCGPRGIKSGFIHLPLMESQAKEFPGLPSLPLATMVEGITLAIEVSRR